LDEREVTKNAFEIIFAFDEAVAMGYKERVNIQQIKHFMTMESHDEQRFKLEEKVISSPIFSFTYPNCNNSRVEQNGSCSKTGCFETQRIRKDEKGREQIRSKQRIFRKLHKCSDKLNRSQRLHRTRC